MDKQKIKKELIKIALDAGAIISLGIGAVALPEFVPFLKDLEVFVAVAAGIWLYLPLRSLIDIVRK